MGLDRVLGGGPGRGSLVILGARLYQLQAPRAREAGQVGNG